MPYSPRHSGAEVSVGKYEPLTHFLTRSGHGRLPMKFEEIERLLGFPLPASSRTHRAWWSNNAANNVMTKAWLAAGYETADVDLPNGRLVFQRRPEARPQTPAPRIAASEGSASGSHPAIGAMKGLVRIEPGVDLTQPADPDWARS